ncbi:inositol 1,4,5-trisphosphate receptor-interacting protein-like 1 [Strigops habroptila]|uniref:inositol 1,4,5-trisphosphate receptor-interacting protein-like 1 n=1 Tax=Strigops habroptila TaxID=2489341 RepID=UPI0011CFB6D0|nr:inositol 1,4,5-trisphosphate receptor-interacting protein-like 1 [Strigops habroptila]XP_030339006.1 inositol 1,4,5-trisphosphate receptor-interacting protein-like 1 [Strigops habroptila]
MAVTRFLLWILQELILNAHLVSDELDEPTRDRMQQRADMLSQEMARLLQELEQKILEQKIQAQKSKEQSHAAWRALLFAALRHWQFWVVVGILLLLIVGLCWFLRKRSHEVGNSSEEGSSNSSSRDEEEWDEQNEEEEDTDGASDLARHFEEHIQWPKQNLVTKRESVKDLVDDLILIAREVASDSSFPVLQPGFSIGSANEGWSPGEGNIIYRVLVPMRPPSGHTFLLELCNPGEMPERNFRIRVELECTCTTEQVAGDMLCFLHHPEEELRRNQGPSLLHTLCTGSYLDVQKTACRFHLLVKASWVLLPHSHQWRLIMLPSSRSCKFKVERAMEEVIIEIVFGVQQGNSDIFVSSQASEAIFSPSTTWTLSCAVAEAKFFELMARQAPHDSFHLRCLQLCTRILVGTGFSSYTLKTVVMHLLTTTPLSGWRSRHFLLRLDDIMRYLCRCLEEKRLDHFFYGNEKIPEEIVLPPALQRAEPLNLFQHLVQDPAAQAEAMREFMDLQDRLTRVLTYGH